MKKSKEVKRGLEKGGNQKREIADEKEDYFHFVD